MFWIAIRPSVCPDTVHTVLTRLALSVTSQCVWHERNTLLMDVSASLQLFAGLRNLRSLLRASLAEELKTVLQGHDQDQTHPEWVSMQTSNSNGELTVDVSISISAMGAWLLAQSARQRIQETASAGTPSGLASGLASGSTRLLNGQVTQHWHYALSHKRLVHLTNPLPVRLLKVCHPYLQWFQGIGCASIADLRKLPRAQLQARTHVGVLQILDQIEARAIWPYRSCEMPEHFVAQRSLDEPIHHAPLILLRLHPLLQQMCLWLQQRHWAVSVWEVRLFHATRRKRQPPSRLRLALAEPGWRFENLSYLLDIKLQAWQLPASVTDLMILSVTVEPRQLRNPTLFADTHTQQQDQRQTLDALRARLGDAAIRTVAPQDDYRPEVANQWCNAWHNATTVQQVQNPLAAVTSDQHSPSWLLPEPEQLDIRDDRPWRNGPLQLLYGPYRIETGWWDHHSAQRDYFVAQDQQARHYWIYRERHQDRLNWYLHGLFG